MKVTFFKHLNRFPEDKLAEAFAAGMKVHGDTCVVERRDVLKPTTLDSGTVAVVGIKSAEVLNAAKISGANFILFDKGYHRWDRIGGLYRFWRISVNGHHPTKTLMDINRPDDRLKQINFFVRPWRKDGDYILLAGSSAKYHRYYGLPDPTEWAYDVVNEIRKHTDRPIYYRPKKSWKAAAPIEGTKWARSRERIEGPLGSAWALVTHGSNACVEALIGGVPSVILGPGVTRSISSTSLSELETPIEASMDDRRQLLANLMYQQWTLREYRSGKAWATIRTQIKE